MKIKNICLNFLDNYYSFYDWLNTDEIEVKKDIYLHKVTSKTIEDFIAYKIKLKDLKLLENDQCLLFTDDFSFLAIEFDECGNSIYKSSLLIKDEIKILNQSYTLNYEKIDYEKLYQESTANDLRINAKIRQTIIVELKTLEKSNNFDKLEFLYYQWFDKQEMNFEKMIDNMYRKLSYPITQKENYIYELIKSSYKLV